ncbi:MAG TPA: MBL fold metallo-hydrolase [Methanocorpusculum sp.]|nr:MBL fold metallo-hydrolase [Methanocorpusculum sp.]
MAGHFTQKFKEAVSGYLSSLSDTEKNSYFSEGEEAVSIREKEGVEPHRFLSLVKEIGDYLFSHSGKNFTADYQKFPIAENIMFYSFQLPGGGNLNVFYTPEGKLVIDTGYGCFARDCENMLRRLGLGSFSDVKSLICTHGDADHCGASGYFPVRPLMHPVTKALLASGTRCYAAAHNGKELLEKFYTTSINTISRMFMPQSVIETETKPLGFRGLFPVIGHTSFSTMNFEIWESLGGHIAGQILLFEPEYGVLFTSDAYINFSTLSKERADYCSVADSMIGSVNVNSEIARTERHELNRLFEELDKELREHGKRLLICCGHGAVCKLDEGKLVPAGQSIHYAAA